ncbi:MAG: hypothetical protein NUV91_09360 [Candidatus Omnitrophica bacterium]|nr:hypothetical protein [Candidatus Omnitrophota bacterium]
MKKLMTAVFFMTIIFGFTLTARAEDRFAVGAEANSLGLGGKVIVKLTDQFNTRIGGNGFQYDYDATKSDVKYDLDLNLLNFSALLDWFPLDNGFRLSTGVIINQNEIDATARRESSYTVGNSTYTSAEVGTLTGHIDFNEAAPYVGLGWGTPFGKTSNWSVMFDLGVMFQGSPDVDLGATGTLAGNAAFEADLQREEDDFEDDLAIFQFYPVVSIGIAYRF